MPKDNEVDEKVMPFTEYDLQQADQRFWPRVDKSGDCWNWTGGVTNDGYGHISIAGNHSFKCHRIAWFILRGPIPSTSLVLHRCDNRRCVNPDHLFLGDHKLNAEDRSAKRRSAGQKRTHCPHGHLYSQSNTRVSKGKRYCRTCDSRRRLTGADPT